MQTGLNPIKHPNFYLWLALPLVIMGGFMLSLAEVRSHHMVWQKLFHEQGTGSAFARAVIAITGWFLVLVPHALLRLDSLNRLQNFTVPPLPFYVELMIPLNDTEPNRYSPFPVMTVLLIFLNGFIFFMGEFLVGDRHWEFLMKYANIPCLVLDAQDGGALSNVTAMFLYGGLFHLVGNMLTLWVFGRRVEDACGPWRFLAFYLFTGT